MKISFRILMSLSVAILFYSNFSHALGQLLWIDHPVPARPYFQIRTFLISGSEFPEEVAKIFTNFYITLVEDIRNEDGYQIQNNGTTFEEIKAHDAHSEAIAFAIRHYGLKISIPDETTLEEMQYIAPTCRHKSKEISELLQITSAIVPIPAIVLQSQPNTVMDHKNDDDKVMEELSPKSNGCLI